MATRLQVIEQLLREIALEHFPARFDLLEASNEAILDKLTELDAGLNEPASSGEPLYLKIGIPVLINKLTGAEFMPGTVTFTDDHDEKVMLNWSDDVGAVHPLGPTTVVSADSTIATGDVTADNNFLFIRSKADGTTTLTLTNGAATDSVTAVIGPAVATALDIDAATAVSVPKGSTA